MTRAGGGWLATTVIAAAVVLGGVARVGTADWGLPYSFHVDEKGFVIWEALAMEHRGLTDDDWCPRINTYGPLALELVIAMKWWWMGGRDHAARVARRYPRDDRYVFEAFGHLSDATFYAPKLLHLMRLVAALAGSLTVLLLALAAINLADRRAGAFTAVLAAACVGLIQASHFYTTEALLMVELGMLLHAASLMVRGRSLWTGLYAGVAIGLIASTKMPGLLMVAALPLAIGADDSFAISASRDGEIGRMVRRAARALGSPRLLVALLVGLAVYRVLCPWAFTEPEVYFDSVARNRSGLGVLLTQYGDTNYDFYDWRFTYNGIPRFWYSLSTVLPYATGVMALAAAGFGLLRGLFRLSPLDRIAWATVLPTFLLIGSFGVQTIRYILPIVPSLLLVAGGLLAELSRRPASLRNGRHGLRRLLAWGTLAHAVTYGLAFTLIFTKPDPRAAGARWLADHANEGDVVVVGRESSYTTPLGTNDDRVGVDPAVRPDVQIRRLWEGAPPPRQVARHLEALLADARFLVVDDFHLRRALHPEALERAPEQARFYRAVIAEQTGYVKVASFESPPRLGPLVFREEGAEVLCVDFDHMPVHIYERRGPFRNPLAPH